MRLKKLYIIICFFLGLISKGQAQLTISFDAAVYGQSLDGLSFARISNTSQDVATARIFIKVRELHTGNVVTVNIPAAIVRPGTAMIDRAGYAAARFTFGNNPIGKIVSQTGRFPEGEYEFCYEVELTEPKAGWLSSFFEQCFVQQLQPQTPLFLINPPDGDTDCITRPSFIWQPPLPLQPGTKFRLLLAERKDQQENAEAINFNLPVLNQGNIAGNQLQYPAGAPPLTEGKTYVWQVTSYNGDVAMKKSEIWTYTVKCNEIRKETAGDSYREMKETEDGNFYIANRLIRFSFVNPYSSAALFYTISNTNNPDKLITGLPKLQMNSGINKYDIDLTDIKAFKNGQEYLLKVRLPDGRDLRLRFIYKDE